MKAKQGIKSGLKIYEVKNFREIKDLNNLVLDKDYVVKNCQDQLGHLLEQDYNNVKVKVLRETIETLCLIP